MSIDNDSAGRHGGGFASKSLAAITIKIGAAATSFLMFLMLARAMSQEEFGHFGFAFSLATILAVIGSFGQRNLVLRFASVYLDRGADFKELHAFGVIRYSYRLVFLGTSILAVILILIAQLPQLESRSGLLTAVAVLVVTMALAEFQPNPQRAAGHVWIALLPRDILLRLGMVALATLPLLGLFPQLTAAGAVWAMSIMTTVLVFCQSLAVPYTSPFKLFRATFDNSDLPKWRQTMWGMWGNSVLNSAGRNIAIVILAVLLPASQLGSFFAALRTSMALELFLVGINIVAAPLLASRLHHSKFIEVQSICKKICLLLGLPTLGSFLLFVFFGDNILELFGVGYSTAYAELLILSTGYLFSAFAGPTTQLMEMGGYERSYFRMLTITTVVSLASIPAATYAFGGVGGAMCIAGNLIGLNLWANLFIFRSTGISPGLIRLGPAPETFGDSIDSTH